MAAIIRLQEEKRDERYSSSGAKVRLSTLIA